MKKWIAILATLIMVCAMSVTAFAAEETMYDFNGVQMHEFPYDADRYPYLLMYKSGSAYNVMASENDFYVTASGQIFHADAGNHVLYNYDGTQWKQLSTIGHTINSATGVTKDTTHWVSHPLMTQTGEAFMGGDPNFFPLVELMAMVTEKTLTETTVPQVMADLSTLIPFGVGLMACLIGLPLFGKVLLRFLS